MHIMHTEKERQINRGAILVRRIEAPGAVDRAMGAADRFPDIPRQLCHATPTA